MTERETELKPTTERSPDAPQLSADELEAQDAAELPDREAMSLVDLNLAAPVNAAVAANILSDGSVAYADADQTAIIDQTTTNDNDVTT